jgi:hypothetical protein
MSRLLLSSVTALFLTGTAHATDKPDELFQKLHQECIEQYAMPGPIAACLFEKEEAFGKELEQVYNKALALAKITTDPLLRAGPLRFAPDPISENFNP